MIEEEIPAALGGERLDRIVSLITDCSRSDAAALVVAGGAAIDGEVQHIGKLRVRTGQVVSVDPAMLPVTAPPAADDTVEFRVVHADEHLIIIDKPAGLVVHPGAGNYDGTLVNALLFRDASLATLPRAGIVHRLDKDTSGVMVVARTLEAHNALVEQLSARDVHRQYLAVVVGALVSGGTADAPIDRHPRDRLRMGVREDGREAVTHYRLRERFRAHTALECRLETGRTHQIRVHMAHLRHSILGDPLYGGSLKLPKGASDEMIATLRGFRRQALHAETLEFKHPVTGEAVRCSAPLPDDMQALLKVLRADAIQHAEMGRR